MKKMIIALGFAVITAVAGSTGASAFSSVNVAQEKAANAVTPVTSWWGKHHYHYSGDSHYYGHYNRYYRGYGYGKYHYPEYYGHGKYRNKYGYKHYYKNYYGYDRRHFNKYD